MKGRPGLIFRKRYSHRAVALRKRQRLDAVIDGLTDRLIKKGFVAVTSDGKLQVKSRQA